jgi:tRNA threonylcarbamoyladenosine dehydratase
MYNCVIMSQDQADKHEKECLVGGKSVEEVWGEETVRAIGKRLQEARKVAEWRQM